MSRSDEDQKKDERPAERLIAIPGYRVATADEPRHRPPSVPRDEARSDRPAGAPPPTAARRASDPPGVRAAASDPPRMAGSPSGGHTPIAARTRPGSAVSGAHAPVGARTRPAAAVSGAHAAIESRTRPAAAVSGAHAAVESRTRPASAVSGAHAAVESRTRPASEVSGAHATVGARRSAPASSNAAPVTPYVSSTLPPAARPGGAAQTSTGGARSIEALQAEVARDDVRVLARQLAEAEGSAVPSSEVPSLASTSAWLRWRPVIAGVLVTVALLVAGWPVLAMQSERAAQARLARVVERAAVHIGQAEGEQIAGWIRARDLRALRELYTVQRPRLVEALRDAGFDEVTPGSVSIRVDYTRATLVVAAQIAAEGADGLTAAADLTGAPVGRPAPSAEWGAIVAEQGSVIGAWLAGALVLVGAMWGVPALMRRRRG